MSLAFLLQARSAAKERMVAILEAAKAEDRALSADEAKEFAQLSAERDNLKSQIEMIQSAKLEEKDPAPSTIGARIMVGDDNKPNKVEFKTLAEFVECAVENPTSEKLKPHRYQSQQNMATGSAGGFLVPKALFADVLRIEGSPAIVRPRARVIPAGSDSPDQEIDIPALDQTPDSTGAPRVFGGVEIYKVAEGGTKTPTELALQRVTLKPNEFAARIPLTDKLLRNTQIGTLAQDLLLQALAQYEDYQFVQGNGVGGPKGIIDEASTYAVARAVSMTVSFADAKNMLARFRGNASRAIWIASNAIFGQLLSMVGDGGGATNVISPLVQTADGTWRLWGIPFIISEISPGLGSKGDLTLTDLSEYLIKDGSGPIVEVGYATGQWETNTRSIKVTFNVDGRSWRKGTFKTQNGYEVASTVVLDVPAGS